jgi:glycosyltransferase involved in cell wall biosynthesis
VIERKPSLIHANSVRAGLVISVATLGLRIPVIWHVHDLLRRHPLSTFIRLFVLVLPPDQIIVVARAASKRFRGDLLRWFSGRVQIAVIHNSVDSEKLGIAFADRVKFRKELRLRCADTLIGIVGNLSPGKGQLELLTAFADVLKKVPNAALLIIGAAIFNRDEGYPERLSRQARALGVSARVRFLGQRGDVPSIMRSLDLLVLNSKSEACPLTALEGLACGVPVLSTAVGGVPELITHGENGWLIPAGNPSKLTDAIVSLLAQPDLRARLRTNGQQHVAENFTVNKFMARVETLWTAAAIQAPQAEKKKQLLVTHPKSMPAALVNRES